MLENIIRPDPAVNPSAIILGHHHVWSHHWVHPATRDESEMMGSFYVNWLNETIWRIETEEGFALDDLLHELEKLEQKAFGYVKHGRLLKL